MVLGLDSAQFGSGLSAAQKKATASASGIQKAFSGVKSAALGFVGGITAGSVLALAKDALDYASSLGEVAQQLGFSTRSLQVYRYAATQVGVTSEEMDKGLAKFTATLGKARTGGADAAKTLRALGLSQQEITTLSPDEALLRVADGLAQIKDRAARGAVEVKLFGKAGQQLDTLLSGGSAAINELATAAEKLGIVLSEGEIAKADEIADKLASLQEVLKARVAKEVVANADAILSLVTALGELVSWLGKTQYAYEQFQIFEAKAQATVPLPIGAARRQEARARVNALEKKQADKDEAGRRALGASWTPSLSRRSAGTGGKVDVSGVNASGGGGTDAPKFTSRKQAIGVAIRDMEALGLRVNGNRQSRGGVTGGHANNAEHNAFAADVNVDKGVVEAKDAGLRAQFDALARKYQGQGFRVIWNGEVYEPGASGPGGRAPGHKDHLDIKAPESIVGKPMDDSFVPDTQAEMYEAAQRAAKEEEDARKERLRAAYQFATDERRGQTDILQAQADIADDEAARAPIIASIRDHELDQEKAALIHAVQMGEMTQARADTLKAQLGQLDALKRQQDRRTLEVEHDRVLEENSAAQAEIGRKALEDEAAMAGTARERRDVEMRILDAAYQEERDRLERVIASKVTTDHEKELARVRLGAMNKEQARAGEQVKRGTMGPLEAYLDQIPKSAAAADEALQSIAANGLSSLTDGITDAIMGARSLQDVFSGVTKAIIADLIKIAVQRAIVAPLANALFGGAASGGAPGGFFGKIAAALGGGQNAVLGKSINAVAASNYAALPGFATGGSFKVGGRGGIDKNLVQFRASRGEMVDIRKPGKDNGGGGSVSFDLRGAVMTQDLLNQMNAIGNGAADRGARQGAAMALNGAARQQRQRFD